MASKRIENGQRMILRGEESFIRIAKGWQKRIAEGQIREILKFIHLQDIELERSSFPYLPSLLLPLPPSTLSFSLSSTSCFILHNSDDASDNLRITLVSESMS